jgi:hypothetical protein
LSDLGFCMCCRLPEVIAPLVERLARQFRRDRVRAPAKESLAYFYFSCASHPEAASFHNLAYEVAVGISTLTNHYTA